MTEQEGQPSIESYINIFNTKEKLKVSNKTNPNFSIDIPKKAYDKISKFSGEAESNPVSFISFVSETSAKNEFHQGQTQEVNVTGDHQINEILDCSEKYLVYPASFVGMDEVSKMEKAPKVKNTAFKKIAKLAGIEWEKMIDYISLQVTEIKYIESSRRVVTFQVFQKIFSLIPLLIVKIANVENFEIAFYSFKVILKMSGIEYSDLLQFVMIDILKMIREELNKSKSGNPLVDKVRIRELKNTIEDRIKDKYIDLYKGTEKAERLPKILFEDLDSFREESSKILNDLIRKVKEKKESIKSKTSNKKNQIMVINDKDNQIKYIRKVIFEAIVNSPESQFDEYKTKDINGDDILINKSSLIEKKDNEPVVKIYNKNQSPDDYLFIIGKELRNIFEKLKFARQEDEIEGTDKNEVTKKEKMVLLDVECDDLPEIDENNLYSIPGEGALIDEVKKHFLDTLNKDDKDKFLLGKRDKYFITTYLLNTIKERDANVENKDIKYKIKNPINENEEQEIEYKYIFEYEDPNTYTVLFNKEKPDEKYILNKDNFINELNSWNNPDDKIKILDEVNGQDVEFEPTKFDILINIPNDVPSNMSDVQNEIIKDITPENTLIKNKDYYIKKTVVEKILENTEQEYDIYYVYDYDKNKVKVSKKELANDNSDPNCQYIVVNDTDTPDEDIICQKDEFVKNLQADPTNETFEVNDRNIKPHKCKKPKTRVKKLPQEEVKLDEQPGAFKKNLLKDVTDYYYIYIDPEEKQHYVRGDTLKLIKDYNSPNVNNFEIEDDKNAKFTIPKTEALKLLDDPEKFVCLEDETSGGEPIMANLEMLEKSEGDIDEEIPIDKDGKKIKLRTVKVKKLNEVNPLNKQPEELKMEQINNNIKDLQNKDPLIDIINVNDANNENIFIFEDSYNKIMESNADPEKTQYKTNNPFKTEVLCNKNPNKVNEIVYVKLIDPEIIVDKNELEKILSEYTPDKDKINVNDYKGEPKEIDPINYKLYKANPEDTEITKILPADFSDINGKLLIDITPQNKLFKINDINNNLLLIKKKEAENLKNLPPNDSDIYTLYDKDGNKIKSSRKEIENNLDNPEYEYITIKYNDQEEIIPVSDLTKALEDKELSDFTTKKFNGEEIKLNKGDFEIVKQNSDFNEVPEQTEMITRKHFLDILNKDDKDKFLLGKRDKYFITTYLLNTIKERDANVENKDIKYKIKNPINENEEQEIEYKYIFEYEDPNTYTVLFNKEKPDEKYILNKDNFINELNSWNNPDDKIKILDEVNGQDVEFEPTKFDILINIPNDVPSNMSDVQNEIIKDITPENTLIKNKDYYIKKTVVEKILENTEQEYDIYYVYDYDKNKVKVSKKELANDNSDPNCQYIVVNDTDTPDEDIICQKDEFVKNLQADPTNETFEVNDRNIKPHKCKKPKTRVKKLPQEEVKLDEQPGAFKKNLLKDVTDYYYIYIDPEEKQHYVRGDTLKLIKDYNSPNVNNFEIEDDKNAKFTIPKTEALKLLDDPEKFVCLEDETSGGEPIMANLEMLEKSEGDIDEEIPIDKDGKKIKLRTVKVKKLNEVNPLNKQPEELKMEQINNNIKDLQNKDPLIDIINVNDANNENIFIFEDSYNKIMESNADPEKTQYKTNNPFKTEVLCNKNPNKVNEIVYVKLIDPEIIVDKNELEKILSEYTPDKDKINVNDYKGEPKEIDPINYKLYKANPEDTEITKILPADFSDINGKLLIDITPQNKLFKINDINNNLLLIKKKEAENLKNLPPNDSDIYTLYDKDGNKIKSSRKEIENNLDNPEYEYITIKYNDQEEIIPVSDLTKALEDKELSDFTTKKFNGDEISLTKSNLEIIKQKNDFTTVPEQTGSIKQKLLSNVPDVFVKVRDSKNNFQHIVRLKQILEIVNHNQKAPFINYELNDVNNQKLYLTKEICNSKLNLENKDKLICCTNDTEDKTFYIPFSEIQESNCEPDDEFEVSDDEKIPFKNLKLKPLLEPKKLGVQPEEEKMLLIIDLLEKLKSGNVCLNNVSQDTSGHQTFITNRYIPILKSETIKDDAAQEYRINDAFDKNIIINKNIADKIDEGDLVKIRNLSNNDYLFSPKNDLIETLKNFISTDEEIEVNDAKTNQKVKLLPNLVDVLPLDKNNLPFEKIKAGEQPKASAANKPSAAKKPKKVFKIRRAVFLKVQKEDE